MAANMIKKYCAYLLCLFLGLVAAAAQGQVLQDPTRPATGFGNSSPISSMAVQPHIRGLQSVIVSPTRCAAIIDGKTVSLGAMHGNERLVEVSAHGVVLRGGGGQRALSLFSKVDVKMTEAVPQDRQAVVCKFEQNKFTENPVSKSGQKEKK